MLYLLVMVSWSPKGRCGATDCFPHEKAGHAGEEFLWQPGRLMERPVAFRPHLTEGLAFVGTNVRFLV